jgi:hypothetical protein
LHAFASSPVAWRFSATNAVWSLVGTTTASVAPPVSTGASDASVVPAAAAHATCASSTQPSFQRSHVNRSGAEPRMSPMTPQSPTYSWVDASAIGAVPPPW